MFGAQNKLSMDKEKYKQRLHDLVEQLATQSPELLDYLRKEVNTAISTKTADAFIKLQRKNMRQKGLLFLGWFLPPLHDRSCGTHLCRHRSQERYCSQSRLLWCRH